MPAPTTPRKRRAQYLVALADAEQTDDRGVAVVGSYRTYPTSEALFILRAVAHTDKTERYVTVGLTRDEARKLVRDYVSFGLFGPHGRIVDTPPAETPSKGGNHGGQA